MKSHNVGLHGEDRQEACSQLSSEYVQVIDSHKNSIKQVNEELHHDIKPTTEGDQSSNLEDNNLLN